MCEKDTCVVYVSVCVYACVHRNQKTFGEGSSSITFCFVPLRHGLPKSGACVYPLDWHSTSPSGPLVSTLPAALGFQAHVRPYLACCTGAGMRTQVIRVVHQRLFIS